MTATVTGPILGMHESYNNNSRYQLRAFELSIPILEKAIDALAIDRSLSSWIIADFGSAQGANSIFAMKTIIKYLRAKEKYFEPFLVIHNDLPSNAWSTLFELLKQDRSYHGVACGRSFYEQCLPSNSLSIGYSSASIQWLSKKPCNITGHCFISHCCNEEEQESFKRQAYLDYTHFLQHRSNELVSGGILVLTIPTMEDEKTTGFDLLYTCAQLLPLTERELYDFTFPIYFRSYEECVDNELFTRFSFDLIAADLVKIESPFVKQWKDKQIKLEDFARLTTSWTRAVSEPIIRQTLITNGRTIERAETVLKQIWALYEDKVKKQPEFNDSYFNTCLIALQKK